MRHRLPLPVEWGCVCVYKRNILFQRRNTSTLSLLFLSCELFWELIQVNCFGGWTARVGKLLSCSSLADSQGTHDSTKTGSAPVDPPRPKRTEPNSNTVITRLAMEKDSTLTQTANINKLKAHPNKTCGENDLGYRHKQHLAVCRKVNRRVRLFLCCSQERPLCWRWVCCGDQFKKK